MLECSVIKRHIFFSCGISADLQGSHGTPSIVPVILYWMISVCTPSRGWVLDHIQINNPPSTQICNPHLRQPRALQQETLTQQDRGQQRCQQGNQAQPRMRSGWKSHSLLCPDWFGHSVQKLAAPQDIHTHPEWPFRAAEESWAALLPETPLQGQGKQLDSCWKCPGSGTESAPDCGLRLSTVLSVSVASLLPLAH